MDNGPASELATVEPRSFIHLQGYPKAGKKSRWHVNKSVDFTLDSQPTETRRVVVLQAGDASEHWLVAILQSSGSEWSFKSLRSFEEPENLDFSGDSNVGESIEPSSIEIV